MERISCRHDDTNSVPELLPLGHGEFFARKIGESLRSRIREEVWRVRASDQVHFDEMNATLLLFSEDGRRKVSHCGELRRFWRETSTCRRSSHLCDRASRLRS